LVWLGVLIAAPVGSIRARRRRRARADA